MIFLLFKIVTKNDRNKLFQLNSLKKALHKSLKLI